MTVKRSGQWFECKYCGMPFYRQPSHIERGIVKTCGRKECISASMRGENNPFWGKNHDQETKDHLKSVKRARPRSPTGPPKGYKHTPEALEKMRAAMKEKWRVNRDKMLARFQHDPKPREKQRYRFTFTPWQRENWKDPKCTWCDATEDLVLDHIIPVMCGGLNERRNAQTLCTPCNMWKLKHVDRPLLLAGLGKQGGQN